MSDMAMAGDETIAYVDREGRAMQVLTQCIGDIVGLQSEIYKNLVRAAASDNPLDHRLAQVAFDALAGDVRRKIWHRVRQLSDAEKPD